MFAIEAAECRDKCQNQNEAAPKMETASFCVSVQNVQMYI